jgi:hypothetical protein
LQLTHILLDKAVKKADEKHETLSFSEAVSHKVAAHFGVVFVFVFAVSHVQMGVFSSAKTL